MKTRIKHKIKTHGRIKDVGPSEFMFEIFRDYRMEISLLAWMEDRGAWLII